LATSGLSLEVRGQIDVSRIRHLQVAGKDVEDSRHIGRALNVGVAAQRIDAAARRPHCPAAVADGGGANDLGAEAVLRPADGIDDSGDFFHVAIFADEVNRSAAFKIDLAECGDALHHFRRVALVLLLQQLINATRMLQRQIKRDVWRQRRRGRRCARCEWRSRLIGGVAQRLTGRSPPSS